MGKVDYFEQDGKNVERHTSSLCLSYFLGRGRSLSQFQSEKSQGRILTGFAWVSCPPLTHSAMVTGRVMGTDSCSTSDTPTDR